MKEIVVEMEKIEKMLLPETREKDKMRREE